MKKAMKRSRRMKWAKRIVFGAVAAAATFAAGYLVAGSKGDKTLPFARFLIPEGQKVQSVWEDKGLWIIRTEDAAGIGHIYGYINDDGDLKIRTHRTIIPVPAEQAFKD